MALAEWTPPDPADVRDCNLCRHANWDPETEWGRCVERRTKHPPESGIYTIHRRLTFTECEQCEST